MVSGGEACVRVKRDEQLGDHDERCSVRVDFAPSFHEFDDRSWGVQKDEALAKEMQVHDIAWKPVGRVGETEGSDETNRSVSPNLLRATRVGFVAGR
jgi:hypothetical protein